MCDVHTLVLWTVTLYCPLITQYVLYLANLPDTLHWNHVDVMVAIQRTIHPVRPPVDFTLVIHYSWRGFNTDAMPLNPPSPRLLQRRIQLPLPVMCIRGFHPSLVTGSRPPRPLSPPRIILCRLMHSDIIPRYVREPEGMKSSGSDVLHFDTSFLPHNPLLLLAHPTCRLSHGYGA